MVEENLFVHFLEVKHIVESQPDKGILEFFTPDIEGEGLHDAYIANGKLFEQNPFAADCRKIVGGGPVLGAILDTPINDVCLERFKCGGRIAEIFVVQFVKIIDADIDIKTTAPMIFDALVDDMASGRKIFDTIRSAAKRWLKGGFTDIALLAVLVGTLPPFLGQNGELADDPRRFTIARHVYGESNLMVPGLLRFGGMAIIGRELRAIFFGCLERKNYVIRRDWRAILPFRLFP